MSGWSGWDSSASRPITPSSRAWCAPAARLSDAVNTPLALESRFDLACNASHALCLAALRRLGYRSSQRYLVFQTIPHTLHLGPEVWRVLAKCHGIRNSGEYEGLLNIDERLVQSLIGAANQVLRALEELVAP